MSNGIRESYLKLLHLTEQGRTAGTVSLISGPPQVSGEIGQMLLVFPDGTVDGSLVNKEITEAVVDHIKGLPISKPCLFSFDYNLEPYRFFLDVVKPKSKAIIFGGGHISQPLTEILAMMEFAVTVLDDRPDFANLARFPQADQVICGSFSQAGESLDIDSNSAVIIVTRGHRYDIECLKTALTFDPKYLGMIGSRGRVAAIMKNLMADGMDPARIETVKSPIGLDIGAQTPVEIAVSIAAEIVAVYRGANSNGSLSEKGRSHG